MSWAGFLRAFGRGGARKRGCAALAVAAAEQVGFGRERGRRSNEKKKMTAPPTEERPSTSAALSSLSASFRSLCVSRSVPLSALLARTRACLCQPPAAQQSTRAGAIVAEASDAAADDGDASKPTTEKKKGRRGKEEKKPSPPFSAPFKTALHPSPRILLQHRHRSRSLLDASVKNRRKREDDSASKRDLPLVFFASFFFGGGKEREASASFFCGGFLSHKLSSLFACCVSVFATNVPKPPSCG